MSISSKAFSDQVEALLQSAADTGWDEARRTLTAAAEAEPQAGVLAAAAGVAAWRSGAREVAVVELFRAAELVPDEPEPGCWLADLLLDSGHAERAEDWLSFVLENVAEPSPVLHRLALSYLDQGLPWSARRLLLFALGFEPVPAAVHDLLETLDALYPAAGVTVVVTVHNAAATVREVLGAVHAQTYPIAAHYVVDRGSTDQTIELINAAGPKLIQLSAADDEAGARNTVLAGCATEFFAWLQADIQPHRTWLERLLLHHHAEQLNADDRLLIGQPLGAMLGHLVDPHGVRLAERWRAVHLLGNYGGGWGPSVPWLFPTNGVVRTSLAAAVGGWPEAVANADCELALKLRAQGRRIAYAPAARCQRISRASLPEVFHCPGGYQSPYLYAQRLATFHTGGLAELLTVVPDLLQAWKVDLTLDRQQARSDLAYPTLLSLLHRVLEACRRAAESAPDDRLVIQQTHAALQLQLGVVLADLAGAELAAQALTDLLPCAPDEPEAAAFCTPETLQLALAAARGESSLNPLEALVHHHPEAVQAVLRAIYPALDDLTADELRAATISARQERAERALPTSGQRLLFLRRPYAPTPRTARLEGDSEGPRGELAYPFDLAAAADLARRHGCAVALLDAAAEGLEWEDVLLRLNAFEPDVVVLDQPFDAPPAEALDLLALWEQSGGAPILTHRSCLTPVAARLPLVQLADGSLSEGLTNVLEQPAANPPEVAVRDLLPLLNYADTFGGLLPQPSCQVAIAGRSAVDVAAELGALRAAYQFDSFALRGTDWAADAAALTEFANTVADAGLRVGLRVAPAVLTTALVAALAAAGVVVVELDQLTRPALDACRAAGLKVHFRCDLQPLGAEALDEALQLDPDRLTLLHATPEQHQRWLLHLVRREAGVVGTCRELPPLEHTPAGHQALAKALAEGDGTASFVVVPAGETKTVELDHPSWTAFAAGHGIEVVSSAAGPAGERAFVVRRS